MTVTFNAATPIIGLADASRAPLSTLSADEHILPVWTTLSSLSIKLQLPWPVASVHFQFAQFCSQSPLSVLLI